MSPAQRPICYAKVMAARSLNNDADALENGPPITAMLMQNANSANVAPDSAAVRRGLTREDLFLCVHEQFMTATAQCADIVLPAAMSFEYDDIYYGLGHTAITFGPKLIEPYAQTRSNHDVVCQLAQRLGAEHPGFEMTALELIDDALRRSGLGDLNGIAERGYVERPMTFEEGHFTDGFPNDTGRFRFKPDWQALGRYHERLPSIVDYADIIEQATDEHPFRLVTPPARMFLNTSFTETPSARANQGRPTALIHPDDAEPAGIEDGARVSVGNARGELSLHAKRFAGMQPGTIVIEGIWPNRDFTGGVGVNLLVGADPVPPAGGVAFHDSAVWLRRS
ncbi:MAG: molybdopterin-dependent oxidoreductase [Pseudomonadota bacterium]